MADVIISTEQKRGCGYRKPAKDGVGVYLVGPSTGVPCGRLPFPLHACAVCGGGIKPSRGWNWIEPRKLFDLPNVACASAPCEGCPLGFAIPEGRHGLLWIGEGFYKTPQEYMAETRRMGVSRKIKTVPKGFKLGETIVYLAHRFAVPLDRTDDDDAPTHGPGIFSVFKPTGIDLVIADENNVPERAEKLAEEHGARIIKVIPEQPGPVESEQHSLPMV